MDVQIRTDQFSALLDRNNNLRPKDTKGNIHTVAAANQLDKCPVGVERKELSSRSIENTEDKYDHRIILYLDGAETYIDIGAHFKYMKHIDNSAAYRWNLPLNRLTLTSVDPEPMKGHYKLEIHGHGVVAGGFPVGIDGGSDACSGYFVHVQKLDSMLRCYSAETIAQKLKGLIDQAGGQAPAKITLFSCYAGREVPGASSFAGRLAMALHRDGINTVISAPNGMVETQLGGRKVYTTDASLSNITDVLYRKGCQFQSKDLEASEPYIAKGFVCSQSLKSTYWVDDGKLKRS